MTNTVRESKTLNLNLIYLDKKGVKQLFNEINDEFDSLELQGFTDIRLSIESTMDPYDDCLSFPELVFNYERPMTKQEIERKNHEDKVRKLAKKRGWSQHQTHTALKMGLVKLDD